MRTLTVSAAIRQRPLLRNHNKGACCANASVRPPLLTKLVLFLFVSGHSTFVWHLSLCFAQCPASDASRLAHFVPISFYSSPSAFDAQSTRANILGTLTFAAMGWTSSAAIPTTTTAKSVSAVAKNNQHAVMSGALPEKSAPNPASSLSSHDYVRTRKVGRQIRCFRPHSTTASIKTQKKPSESQQRQPLLSQKLVTEHVNTAKQAVVAADTISKLRGTDEINIKIWTPEQADTIANNIGALRKSTRDFDYPLSNNTKKRSAPPTSPTNPSKRVKKISNEKHAHLPVSLAVLKPQPIRLDFEPHTDHDRDDQWFIDEFNRLCESLETFAGDYFGVHDLLLGTARERGSEPWTEITFGEEFLFWAEQVVEIKHDDKKGWEQVLKDTKHRQWLVMGIVMKILKEKVFDVLLFGADEHEQKLLENIDECFMDREGISKSPTPITCCCQNIGNINSEQASKEHSFARNQSAQSFLTT